MLRIRSNVGRVGGFKRPLSFSILEDKVPFNGEGDVTDSGYAPLLVVEQEQYTNKIKSN